MNKATVDSNDGPLFLANQSFSLYLDLLRWGAAFLVLLQHARWRMFAPFAEVTDKDPVSYALYLVSGFGHEAVVVFFVLSGYLVGARAWTNARSGNFEFGRYLVDRVTRLHVVAIPAILVGIGLDRIGYLQGAAIFYSDEVMQQTTADVVACNIGMLQGFACAVVGSNAPLWSLAFEFWFYIVCGFLCLGFGCRTNFGRMICLLSAVAICVYLGALFLFGLTIWFAGLAAGVLSFKRNNLLLGIAVGLLVLGLLMGRLSMESNFAASDIPLSLGLAMLLHQMKGRQLAFPAIFARPVRVMADHSYTLYAIHYPVLLLTLTFAFDAAQGVNQSLYLQPTHWHVALFLAVVLMVMASAYLFSLVTEKQTAKLRRAGRALLRRDDRRTAGRVT